VISPDFAIHIHQNQNVLDSMNDWCKENLKDVAENSLKSEITEAKAEEMMLEFISKFIPSPHASPLAGNTIYMDRMFLKKYFPKVDNYLHYRLIDVSAVKELCRRWNKKVYDNAPKKELKHRALSDVIESIAELKFYRDNFMNVQA
jgi:oligoribonuclease